MKNPQARPWVKALLLLVPCACGTEAGSRPERSRVVRSSLLVPTRGDSIPIGIENVNDSPMKAANYRTLLRFVPDSTVTIDRFYFGFKLLGASCWNPGAGGYGSGDGGTLQADLVNVDPVSGLPATTISSETVNGCTRHMQASAEVGGTDPVLVWVNTPAVLQGDTMYALVVRNVHADPVNNYFSFNMPLSDTTLAGPHARNELSGTAAGAIMSLDPREHVAWSADDGATWQYGSNNGQYRSYMRDHDTAHPATRMPQYGWRVAGGTNVGQQPYYAYSQTCTGCSVTYANARYARSFTQVGGWIAQNADVGVLTLANATTGASARCTPGAGYGFRTCTLASPITVAVGDNYTIGCTGSVEVMKMDNPQRVIFPNVGTPNGELRAFQANPAPNTNAKDVPSLWAGPTSAAFPGAGDPGDGGDGGGGTLDADASTGGGGDGGAPLVGGDVGPDGPTTDAMSGTDSGSRDGRDGTIGSVDSGDVLDAGDGTTGRGGSAPDGSSNGCTCDLTAERPRSNGSLAAVLLVLSLGVARRRALS